MASEYLVYKSVHFAFVKLSENVIAWKNYSRFDFITSIFFFNSSLEVMRLRAPGKPNQRFCLFLINFGILKSLKLNAEAKSAIKASHDADRD